jgi:hypothetical protein
VPLVFGLGLVALLLASAPYASATMADTHSSAKGPVETVIFDQTKEMPAFLNGKVVNTAYEQGFFVGAPTNQSTTYGMEPLAPTAEVGQNATVLPGPMSTIDTLWVLVPWWGPAKTPYAPAYDPEAYGIQTMCAPATIAVCYDHPATISIPGLGVVPLPAHDHLIGSDDNYTTIWWCVVIDLVYQQSVWPTLNASHGITSLGTLFADQKAKKVSPDLPTDLFLNFKVLPADGAHIYEIPPSTHAVYTQESMPAFQSGKVVDTIYQQGYFVGNLSYNSSFGTEPLMAQPEVGTAGIASPAPWSLIEPFIVLVPWWGPAKTPYAPAYDPSAYGIQLDCAPASVAVCWDHPPTISVPGLGVVPLPGHDHLIGSSPTHQDIWWNLEVVLVLNASVFPNFAGTHGINSVSMLKAAEADGLASAELPTNVFFNFVVE